MTRSITTINLITVFGAVGLLVMSLWPGYASGCWLLLGLAAVAVLGISWMFVVTKAWYHRKPLPLRQAATAPLLVCVTFVLLRYYVPRRVAFLAVRHQFESHLTSAPVGANESHPFGRRVGLYKVDQYAADPRGGVYFRTGRGADGLGPDTLSFGFVHRPNPTGTPFGAARYRLRPLTAEWYWFQASDDWYAPLP